MTDEPIHDLDVVHEIGDTPDPDTRLATVRVERGRIEIILVEPDREWVAEKLALDQTVRGVIVIGCRTYVNPER